MHQASVGFQCPSCVAEGNKSVRQARTIYGGAVHGADGAVVTKTLIGINIAVFIATTASGVNFFSGNTGNSRLFDHLALIPPAVGHGDWYRIFTAAFLHFGIFHIAFNMYALWLFGPPLEAALGRLRYLVLYLLAGVGGSILSVALGPLNETAAGASGAIFGVFGAFYIVARHRKMPTQGIAITIGVNLLLSLAVPNIDWRGHVGGLIVGSAVAAVIAFAPQGPNRNRLQVLGVAVISVALVLAGFYAVHRVNHGCATAVSNAQSGSSRASDQQNAAYCLHYDPQQSSLTFDNGT
jgi:membrane associated rhomboid family serine protease